MGLLELLTLAYGATGFISLAGYMPQFRTFWKNPRACNDSPLAMWGLWTFQGGIVLMYAAVVNGDPMVMLSGGLSVGVNGGGLLFVLWSRRRAHGMRTRASDKPSAEVVAFPAASTPDNRCA